jgi:hypothetical protein
MNAARDHDGHAGSPANRRGGLPEDPDLDAFRQAAEGAFGAPRGAEQRLSLAAVPSLAAAAGPGDAAEEAAPDPGGPVQAHPAAGEAPALPDVPHRDLPRQASITVDAEVAQRFRAYQRQQASNGPTLFNHQVVFLALRACRGRYADVVARHQPQAEPEAEFPFGAPVPGRRATSEARSTSQLNFRPTHGEFAAIRQLQKEAEAPSVSAFLNAVLDEFLPPLIGRSSGRGSR